MTTARSKQMAEWEEIKRLAADLQRAQLSGSAQRYALLYVLFPRLIKMPGITAFNGANSESMKTYGPLDSP